jgi:hypothetical protein
MNLKKYYVYILLIFFAIASCTSEFEEINTDPNRPKEIYPGVLLSQMQYRFVNTGVSAARNFTHEVMQVTSPRSSTTGGLHRYEVEAGTNNGLWQNFYSYMTDAQDLYDIAERLNENNYKAIALIYKSWAYSILTDCFGDIPYSQATKVTDGIFKPAFDQQKEIYTALLNDLDAANTLLDDTKGLTYAGDLVFNASTLSNGRSAGILRWKKFANSLRLRMLLRISKRNGEINVNEQINAILADPAKYPVFTGTADDAILKYPGTFPYFNPFYNARTLDWRDGTYYTKFFLDKMNAVNDPRRAIWMTTVKVNNVNVYQGIESGYPGEVIYVVGANSSYPDALKTLPQMGIMMTYAELEFIKAELALKGFNTGSNARTHYERGITASMTQWGATMPSNFLQQSGIVYNESATVTDQLKQIMQQKYYALFFTDYQAWFEKNRTGFPELPRGAGIPAENQFPLRTPYPTYLQSLNAENLDAARQQMGGDNSTTLLWWQK